MNKKIRKSLVLTQQQWQVLDELATRTDSQDTYHKTGKISWRKMVERIASEELSVIDITKERSDLLTSIKILMEEY